MPKIILEGNGEKYFLLNKKGRLKIYTSSNIIKNLNFKQPQKLVIKLGFLINNQKSFHPIHL